MGHHRWYSLVVSTLFAAVLWSLVLAALDAASANPVEPAAAAAASGRYFLFPTSAADQDWTRLPAEPLARRRQMIQDMRAAAGAAQTPLLGALDPLLRSGEVKIIRPFWIVNAILVEASPAGVSALAKIPLVGVMRQDRATAAWHDEPPPGEPGDDRLFAPQIVPAGAAAAPAPKSYGLDQIAAPFVWYGLGVTGTGATIAFLDTGVDWQHPDLRPAYRGLQPDGSVRHQGNWFNAAYPTETIPTDPIWHGTHVAGTAVGQNGIGVAPGARWIAAAIADRDGLIFDSYVYAAFEWLLAPAGDPTLAPDIVNGSWGTLGSLTSYLREIDLLREAGIMPVFSAGNSGPTAESIAAPASFTSTLAVGATDFDGQVTWFSSRGPSPLTRILKPDLAAPGAAILSTFPDGRYAVASGTSMAAPHVAGTLALLRSIDPTIRFADALAILTATARPLNPSPDFAGGWGEVNAYQAAASLINHGRLEGTIRAQGRPLSGIRVEITTPDNGRLAVLTDGDGRFQLRLIPGLYDLRTAGYGYQPASASGVPVRIGEVTIRDFDLLPAAGGVFQGQVTLDGSPVAGARLLLPQLQAAGQTDAGGRFAFFVPQGIHDVEIQAAGARLERITILMDSGGVVRRTIRLQPAPRILLVDSGRWIYQSQLGYYQEALQEANYYAEVWSIADPFSQAPTLTDLLRYDTVIWSDPFYDPGAINANETISNYLDAGGHLLISGQDIGFFASQEFSAYWWFRQLAAEWVDKENVSGTFSGETNGLFDGVSFTLNGPLSAGNQRQIDVVQPRPGSLTRPIIRSGDGRAVGLESGRCEEHRIVYFGFGLEAVQGKGDRAELITRAFDYFASPRIQTGARWLDGPVEDLAIPGKTMTYAVGIQNLSESITDTFIFDTQGGRWPHRLSLGTAEIGPCAALQVVLTMTVPAGLGQDVDNRLIVRARSTLDPNLVLELPIHHKTTGRLLVVDDHRWYPALPMYTAALNTNGVRFDVWATDDGKKRGSPPLELLTRYEQILWFTGYDWFQPITAGERERLEAYLEQGGRLFLTSQDFLFYHRQSALARRYFGIVDYIESVTPTVVFAGDSPLRPPGWREAASIDFTPYQNNGDALILADPESAIWWHDRGAAGTGRSGLTGAGSEWRAIFWGVPFEKLPEPWQGPLRANALGWIGNFGGTTLTTSQQVVRRGETFDGWLALRHAAGTPTERVTVTLAFPPGLQPGPVDGWESADPLPAPTAVENSWSLLMTGGQTINFRWPIRVAATVEAGRPQTITLAVDDGYVTFRREVVLQVESPNLTSSTVLVDSDAPRPGDNTVTMTIHLANTGMSAADPLTAAMRLPDFLFPLTGTLRSTSGLAQLTGRQLAWEGALPVSGTADITLVMTRTQTARSIHLPSALTLFEPQASYRLVYNESRIPAFERYFPTLYARNE